MKRLLTVFIFLLFFCLAASGQKTILEVRENSFAVVVRPEDYLFLRVRSNGQVEYQEAVFKNNKRKFKLRKYKLSAEKLQELKDFLNEAQVERIAGEYSPDVPIYHHYIGIDIKITRKTKSQTIRLINYDPNSRDAAEEYPRELIELVCRIRALRSNTGFWLLKNDCVLNRKEK